MSPIEEDSLKAKASRWSQTASVGFGILFAKPGAQDPLELQSVGRLRVSFFYRFSARRKK